MSQLQVSRDSGFADKARDYHVVVNGESVGTIADGETKLFDVPTGNLDVVANIDWCSSNTMHLQSRDNHITTLSVGSSLRGVKLILAMYYVLFKPTQYLWLRHSQSNEQRKAQRSP